MSGGGSIQDMNNRIRDNRALLGQRKLRFKAGKRFFDKKPILMTSSGKPGARVESSESQLEEIRIKVKREASFNQVAAISMFVICIAVLAWLVYIIL